MTTYTSVGDTYTLITSAYNEALYLGNLIESVVQQTILPFTWFIVDDGSSDTTRDVIHSYAEKYPIIVPIDREPSKKAGFLSKVEALNLALVYALEHDVSFIGILDADVTVQPSYFEELIGRFLNDPRLGVAGGSIFALNSSRFSRHRVALQSVSGAVQFFRKEVVQVSTPFRPFRHGGEDAACTIIARAHGWRTRTFLDLPVLHHRPVGLGNRKTRVANRFRKGRMFFDLGFSPSFHAARAIGRVWEKPYVVGVVIEIAGFYSQLFRSRVPLLPAPVVRYLRDEQRRRLLLIDRVLSRKPSIRSARLH